MSNSKIHAIQSVVALGVMLLAVPAVQAQCDPAGLFLPPPQAVNVAGYTYYIAMQDFNSDGVLDVAVTHSFGVRVLLGVGDGTFQSGTTYATGSSPQEVAVGDLNGDGVPDLVVANKLPGTISVLLGNGDGTFQNRVDFAAGYDPQSVAIGDLDGDGIPDIAVANYTSLGAAGSISVLRGNGDGTFQPRQSFATRRGAHSVAIADLNGDGWPDLVVANRGVTNDFGNTVSVLLSNGNGSFAAHQTYETGLEPSSVAVRDLNQDGVLDLVVANAGGWDSLERGDVSVLLGNGDGTFQSRQDIETGRAPRWVHIADFDADGQLDLAVANAGSNTVSIHPGRGDGTFGPRRDFGTGGTSISVVAGDLNNNGVLDLVVGDVFLGGSFRVLPGVGDGTFRASPRFETGRQPESVVIGDINHDGIPDLAVAARASNLVSILLGEGDGTFRPRMDYPTGSRPMSVAMADLNADGMLDLAVANRQGTVSVFLGNGDGTLQPRQDITTGGAPMSVAIGDLNHDGLPDLAVAKSDEDAVLLLFGQGDGAFQPGPDIATGVRPVFVAIADLNADGLADMVVANETSDTVTILLHSGTNGSYTRLDYAVGPMPRSLAIGDLNGDGVPDLVVANPGPSDSAAARTISLLMGNGDGTFQPRQQLDAVAGPHSVAIGDLNHDGIPDLAVAMRNSSTNRIFIGLGDGSFHPGIRIAGGRRAQSIALSDLNGDGRLDIVAADYLTHNVSALLNQCTPATACRPDLNNDGLLNFFDIAGFLSLYQTQDPLSDWNADGLFNFFDLAAYLSDFNAGCP